MSRTTGMKQASRCVVAGFVLFVMPAGALAQSTTQVVEYYHTDALGSVRAVTKQVNGQWQVVARYDYMPFGEETAAQAPPPFNRLFSGKEKDQETGQDYFGARYYRANLGRFTTVDPVLPIEDARLDPQRWNRYTYVMNRPLVLTDPDGRCPSCFMLLQRIASSPAVQRASTWAQTQGVAAWNWATRVFNSPAGQEAVQTVAELATGAQAPSGLLPALSATSKAAFLEAAVAEGRGGVSAAGRALQSHAARAGSWLAGLAEAGDAAANTAAARKELAAILESGRVTSAVHKVWGDVVYVRRPDGSGAVWSANGEFITFLERYTSKQ